MSGIYSFIFIEIARIVKYFTTQFGFLHNGLDFFMTGLAMNGQNLALIQTFLSIKHETYQRIMLLWYSI